MLAASLLGPAAASAQFRADSMWQDVRYMGGDIWSIWTAPVHARARDLSGVVAFTGAVGAAAILDRAMPSSGSSPSAAILAQSVAQH